MDTGSGYHDLCKLTSKMSLGAGLTTKRYYQYHNVICDETAKLSSKLEVSASECVSSYYEEDLNISRSEDGILNVDVSYDGTWMTRGHSSKMSAGFVIEADTGLILDHECLSKYCHICVKIRNKYMNNEQLLNGKMTTHKESGQCQCNFEGTSEKHGETNGYKYVESF